MVDWEDYDAKYTRAGLIPPKDHTPIQEDMMVYTDDGDRVGYATSSMYSPMLQRHIALARVRPEAATAGTKVNLEYTIDHQYQLVGANIDPAPAVPPREKDQLMPSDRTYDAIVIGGGHNGLTNGAYLAKAGLRTFILERRSIVGGAAITEELRPGFNFTTFSYALSLLQAPDHPRTGAHQARVHAAPHAEHLLPHGER